MPASSLKILREVNDYTQVYVAETVLGMNQASYARLEKDPSKITGEQAKKLAALYKVDANDILMGRKVVLVFPEGPYTRVNGTKNGYTLMNNHHGDVEIKMLLAKRDFLVQQNAALIDLLKLLCMQGTIDLDKEQLQKINGHAMEH